VQENEKSGKKYWCWEWWSFREGYRCGWDIYRATPSEKLNFFIFGLEHACGALLAVGGGQFRGGGDFVTGGDDFPWSAGTGAAADFLTGGEEITEAI
jgi:hypothetical protein